MLIRYTRDVESPDALAGRVGTVRELRDDFAAQLIGGEYAVPADPQATNDEIVLEPANPEE